MDSERDEGTPDFRGNRPRSVSELRAWHLLARGERILEPELPIVDAHHHLYGEVADSQHYRIDDLLQDVAAGHRVLGTVYVEAFNSAWRPDGPPAMRSLGEVEMIVARSAQARSGGQGACQIAAGIVSNVDLALGDGAVAVLEAHVAAAQGRLRGVRVHATWDPGQVGRFTYSAPKHLLADGHFRQGFAWLERFDLSFDALVFHTQLEDVMALADAFPHTRIVLNHAGTVLGVSEYKARHASVFVDWERDMHALARRANVSVKIGGMGMLLFGFGFEHAERPASSDALVHAWKPHMEVCIEAFGTQRCMFESNFPVDKQSCTYVALWNAFKRATRTCSADERRDLFYRTACRSYQLPALEQLCDDASTEQPGREA